ncbi:glycoside hydrolase family 3 protein [Treponema sp.]|uniref:glycoside hydrolase family 3 protein n=1 Tax=Treponema sp. TaxID=166 RepID=UPI00298DB8CD|nr:glycoside hydrolase family 3 protein [Treponema sp.]
MKRIAKYLVISLLALNINSVFAQSSSNKNLMHTVSKNSADVELNLDLSKYPEDLDFWSDVPNAELAYVISKRMSDEELLSQMLMFGWAGAEPSELLNSWVRDRGLGSVKVFGWNTDNTTLVAKSITALQKKAQSRRFKIPLFVATDQEGGWIRHVKGNTSITPGNLSIGAGGLPIDSWYSAYYICREIAVLGINLNFAPTVDLYTDQNSTIIGTRSFGEDPEKAGIMGVAFAAGSMSAGVIPTAKHFPGHGDTENDSHVFLPKINADFDTISKRELVPFKYLIDADVPAIMSGHLSFPLIRQNGEPASLSPYFLGELLRNQLGYKGLIITDDMMMNGDTLYAGSLSNAFKLAIEAGNDIVISSTTAQLNENLWTSNLQRMKDVPQFKTKVETAVRRILEIKMNYFKNTNSAPLYPDVNAIDAAIPDPDGGEFFVDQACRSITVYRKGELPYLPQKGKKVILAGSEPAFFNEMKKYYKDSIDIRMSYNLGSNEAQYAANLIAGRADEVDVIFVCVWDRNSVKTAEALKPLQKRGKKIVVFSIMSPVLSFNLDWADTVLFGYSYSPYSFTGLAAVASGRVEPEGVLPISVEK